MKKLFKNLTIALTCAVSFSAIADVSVIVHPSNNTEVSQEDVSRIFLGRKKSFSNGNEAVPVSQEEGSPVRTEFNEKVLSKSDAQLKAYWSKLVFTGKGTPPKQVMSDAEIIKLISQNPSMVGYVDSASVDSSVKQVLKF